MSEVDLSLVILTEDGSKDARPTIEALVRKMLALVVPGCRLHDRVTILPREPYEEEAMRGTGWKAESKDPRAHERRVRLLRYIARRLSQPNTFVIFHIDGDRPWKKRHESENVAKFDKLVVNMLPHVVERGRASRATTRRASGSETTPPEPTLNIDHLLLLCPFRSIEAWLYQNISRAVVICRRHHGGRHERELVAWESARAELDELERPEEKLCLKKDHNLELATQGFPAEVAFSAGKSFAESALRMQRCAGLRFALERTIDAPWA